MLMFWLEPCVRILLYWRASKGELGQEHCITSMTRAIISWTDWRLLRLDRTRLRYGHNNSLSLEKGLTWMFTATAGWSHTIWSKSKHPGDYWKYVIITFRSTKLAYPGWLQSFLQWKNRLYNCWHRGEPLILLPRGFMAVGWWVDCLLISSNYLCISTLQFVQWRDSEEMCKSTDLCSQSCVGTDQGNDCSPVLGTGETSKILCSVWGLSWLRWWSLSREGQQRWRRLWSTSMVRSSWGSWGSSAWRKGGSEGTFSPSTTPWQEGETWWRSDSAPK